MMLWDASSTTLKVSGIEKNKINPNKYQYLPGFIQYNVVNANFICRKITLSIYV
jgi:hypothetical protein